MIDRPTGLGISKPLLDRRNEPSTFHQLIEGLRRKQDASRPAVDNRIACRLGRLSKLLTPVLLVQLRPRLGVKPAQLRPITTIASLRCPVLVAGGTLDPLTTEPETRRLYAAANDPKELWLVPGAGHWDLHATDPEAYADHVFAFLMRHMEVGSP